MRTLLVLTSQTSMAAAIQAVIAPSRFQVIERAHASEAEFLLVRGGVDAVILDADLTDSRASHAIQEIKQFAPGVPLIIYAGAKQWEYEEDAYLLGVEHVIAKPVRGRLLNTLLDRLFPDHAPQPAHLPPVAIAPAPASVENTRSLEPLRRFSTVLAHGLDAVALLKQFLLLLREVVGVNRAVVFLRKPPAGSAGTEGAATQEDRWLRSACAIGIDQAMLAHFALSLGAGIGGHLYRHGRILRATGPESQASREISKEFQLIGAQVAIPILDRESLVGVAVLDERLTGEPYTNDELALIFHLLEEVGIAVRNAWQHDHLFANRAMIADILCHLGTASAVFAPNLAVLHANEAAGEIFLAGRVARTRLEFSDLPQRLGSMVFTVLKTGTAVAPFKDQIEAHPGRWFRFTITPFRMQHDAASSAALLVIDDITEHERAQALETEASNLRLVKAMAEHLAHEIGNALVPISTHQQLLAEQIGDLEFQESLSAALASGVKRISRLSAQMMFLAREWKGDLDQPVKLADLIVAAFHEAHGHHSGKKLAQLHFDSTASQWSIPGDARALRHAFTEIMLNAIQANPDDPMISVHIQPVREAGQSSLAVEVRDSGAGFTNESAQRATEPFFSTRSVGLGIGLTVSNRIIENHRGHIDISPAAEGQHGMVRVSLPAGSVKDTPAKN